VRGSIACPEEALRAWRNAAGITTGPPFRSVRKGGKVGNGLSDQSVADIVKHYAERSASILQCSPAIRFVLASSRPRQSAGRQYSR
jgi:hypothetical protein